MGVTVQIKLAPFMDHNVLLKQLCNSCKDNFSMKTTMAKTNHTAQQNYFERFLRNGKFMTISSTQPNHKCSKISNHH